jgi:hypothetical protein
MALTDNGAPGSVYPAVMRQKFVSPGTQLWSLPALTTVIIDPDAFVSGVWTSHGRDIGFIWNAGLWQPTKPGLYRLKSTVTYQAAQTPWAGGAVDAITLSGITIIDSMGGIYHGPTAHLSFVADIATCDTSWVVGVTDDDVAAGRGFRFHFKNLTDATRYYKFWHIYVESERLGESLGFPLT